jgi:hypothetical protein
LPGFSARNEFQDAPALATVRFVGLIRRFIRLRWFLLLLLALLLLFLLEPLLVLFMFLFKLP